MPSKSFSFQSCLGFPLTQQPLVPGKLQEMVNMTLPMRDHPAIFTTTAIAQAFSQFGKALP